MASALLAYSALLPMARFWNPEYTQMLTRLCFPSPAPPPTHSAQTPSAFPWCTLLARPLGIYPLLPGEVVLLHLLHLPSRASRAVVVASPLNGVVTHKTARSIFFGQHWNTPHHHHYCLVHHHPRQLRTPRSLSFIPSSYLSRPDVVLFIDQIPTIGA